MERKLMIDENMYGYSLGKNELISVHLEHHFYKENGSIFPLHWHEQLMLMYIEKGVLLLQCGEPADLKQTMYTELLLKNRLLFENKISNDPFLLGCMKYLIKVSNQSELEMQYRRLKQIKPAISYMESHLAEKITLEHLAEVAHLSSIHFSRVFNWIQKV